MSKISELKLNNQSILQGNKFMKHKKKTLGKSEIFCVEPNKEMLNMGKNLPLLVMKILMK